jgi:hypothetical protein
LSYGAAPAEPLVPDLALLRLKLLLKGYKSSGSDQIPAEPIQARGKILRSEIHTLIISIWNKKELHQGKDSIIVPIYKKGGKLTLVIMVKNHCYQLHTKLYPIFFFQG